MVMPVEGGVGSESEEDHRNDHHHWRPEPSHTSLESPTKTSHLDFGL